MSQYESSGRGGRHLRPSEDEDIQESRYERQQPRSTARRPIGDGDVPARPSGQAGDRASRQQSRSYQQGTRSAQTAGRSPSSGGRSPQPADRSRQPGSRSSQQGRAPQQSRQPQGDRRPPQGSGRPPQGGGRPPRRGRNMRPWQIAGIILSAVLIIIVTVFCIQLGRLGMLPNKYRNLIWVILAALSVCILALQLRHSRAIGSKVVAVILAVIMLVGLIYITKALSALGSVTDVSVQYYSIGVYVQTDDPAESITDASGYTFGILTSLDRDNTDECLDAIVAEQGVALTAVEYESVVDLATALLSGDVQAIVMNSSYLSALSEASSDGDISEELGQFSDETKVIYEYTVERTIERVVSGIAATTEDGTEAYTGSDGVYSISEDPFIVYISGNDTSGTLASTGRSDVNILAVVNPSTRRILLVNTPRDYYVTLAFTGGSKDKLTHAGIYGVDVSMQALEDLYDISIQYYVRMNFPGFEEIIDALGGVSVYSEYAFTSTHGGYTFTVGYNDVNGAQALAFVRERYSFTEGDRQRGKNQMAMIEAVIDKALSSAILTNYMDVMNAASAAFATNMTQSEISSLVQWQLATGGSWTVDSTAVTGSDSTGTVYSMGSTNVYRMLPDDDSVAAAVELINEVLEGN
ncbi:MAG: LCP family protein [Oscillospiraceae bacterium]|nr:LCP family protein [Oscillospiraceae bacterium]